MKIRSITCFFNPGWPLQPSTIHRAGDFIQLARQAFIESGWDVETVRLATPPFPLFAPGLGPEDLLHLAQSLEAQAAEQGFDYISLGPALPAHPPSYLIIPKLLGSTQNVFVSGMLTNGEKVSLSAVKACADVIHRASRLGEEGFTNLRFTALANVPPGSPFFPGAYHEIGAEPAFAIATEAADLVVEAFAGAATPDQARSRLISAIEGQGRRMSEIGQMLENEFGVKFGGIDFSPAPFPEESLSLGTALEKLGGQAVGMHGSLAAAALLADSLDQADFPRTGLSGLMLPVLEDFTLARRAAEGMLTVKDLLLFSAVCGTGLDTIPLPGDASVEQLSAVLLDVAALALRLDKPLTARLMPIPGKAAGEETHFDFSYFANSRILKLDAGGLSGPFAGDTDFEVRPRKR